MSAVRRGDTLSDGTYFFCEGGDRLCAETGGGTGETRLLGEWRRLEITTVGDSREPSRETEKDCILGNGTYFCGCVIFFSLWHYLAVQV